jgi:hypothetical protein
MEKPKLILVFWAIIMTPALIGILGCILQLFEILNTQANLWLMSCFMLSIFAGFFLIGIAAPIVLLVLFISQLRDKEDPSRMPAFAFFLLVLMGGGMSFGAYHSFLHIPEMFSRFLEGFSRFVF